MFSPRRTSNYAPWNELYPFTNPFPQTTFPPQKKIPHNNCKTTASKDARNAQGRARCSGEGLVSALDSLWIRSFALPPPASYPGSDFGFDRCPASCAAVICPAVGPTTIVACGGLGRVGRGVRVICLPRGTWNSVRRLTCAQTVGPLFVAAEDLAVFSGNV